MKLVLFSVVAIYFACTVSSARPQNVMCYFTSWSVYKPGNGIYNVSNVPADLCTHIYYSFVGLNDDGTVNILDTWEAFGLRQLLHLRRLRHKNKDLKLIVSMGGWNEGSETYSRVSGDPALRKTMISSVISFLKEKRFDGFDLDWEYPAQRGGAKADVDNFVTLLGELNQALKAEEEKYLLTVAVSGGVLSADISYDYKKLAEVVDYINVMAYDYHGDWETYTGHYAPLHASHLDTGDNALLNVETGFGHWIKKGVPPSKLNLGIGTYGRTFTLQDPSNQGLYAPVTGAGKETEYSQEAGIIGFNELCEFYPNAFKDAVYDEEQMVPHVVVDGNQWIGYDDVSSVTKKSIYARDIGAAGVMIWSLDTDDYLNKCGQGEYPLINAMKQAWNQ
ncbi:hypothetical protein HHI36_003651 [Cryptolaemus montrouzieri]|uniref:GH18 domain-containing protein n=1 Tax=Cryptolaemus montrouzieri TaxID=559131 RepID=A0ABD2PEJ0_9CUCU